MLCRVLQLTIPRRFQTPGPQTRPRHPVEFDNLFRLCAGRILRHKT